MHHPLLDIDSSDAPFYDHADSLVILEWSWPAREGSVAPAERTPASFLPEGRAGTAPRGNGPRDGASFASDTDGAIHATDAARDGRRGARHHRAP